MKLGIPATGLPENEIFARLNSFKETDAKWEDGKTFCLIYSPGKKYNKIIKEAYNLFLSENALNPTAFPSLNRIENEVVEMIKHMLNAPDSGCGTMSSGGTESIGLVVKTARDFGKKKRGINNPNIVVGESVHPAFQKAGSYFDVEVKSVGLDIEGKINPEAVRNAIDDNTVMIVGSAPSYPHGIIDPIGLLSKIALERDVLLHVDACIGGMILPFIEANGENIPLWDFRHEGVTSISVDIHKFGYCPKGASIIVYRNKELRKHQFFVYTEWMGGIYGSTTMLGSRGGGPIAGAWAAINSIGFAGYKEMARVTMLTTRVLLDGIGNIPDIEVIGNPKTCLFAIKSDKFDVFELGDILSQKGWHFDRMQNPSCLHFTISFGNVGKETEFLEDLKKAHLKVSKINFQSLNNKFLISSFNLLHKVLPKRIFEKLSDKFSPSQSGKAGSQAPIYGMMGTLGKSGQLKNLVLNLLDKMYRYKG